jgi:Phage integrase family
VPGQLSQYDHAADPQAAAVDGWHELSVANPTFLLERLGTECTDLQGLRELTVNGLDAINAQDPVAGGRVVWDMDWLRFEASAGRVRKLSVTDTGTGMTPEQLRQYINQLASSGRKQSAANFGVGAKIAAGSRNPHRLEYRSWHRGQGALVCFKRHPDGRWGLEPQHWPDGRSEFWRPLGEQEKPWVLRGLDHGTQVVLLGRHERHDTIQAADSVTERRRRWITRYLNGRFLRLPERVEVLVREQHGHEQPRQLQRIHGERHHLQQRAIAAGVVQLSDAIARWWVLDDDHRARRRESTVWASTATPPPSSARSSTTPCRRPVAGTGAFRTSASASATKGSYYTSNRASRLAACSATPPERCCCSTTSHSRGLAGRRSSLPRCPQRSCASRNTPRALTAFRASRRSATASVRSCRSWVDRPERVARALAALDGVDRGPWTVALYAGLRVGEIQALRWADVDFDRGVLRVERAWDRKAGPIAPKSRAGRRTVPMSMLVRRELRELQLRSGRRGGDLVFGRTAELAFVPQVLHRHSKAAWDEVGLTAEWAADGMARPGLHDAGHHCLTHWGRVWDIGRLHQASGHSDIRQTQRYLHVPPDRDAEDAARLDAYLGAV